MVKTNTTSRKATSETGDELPFEFHIVGTIKPGDDDRHLRYRITDVIVSPTDEDDLELEVDEEEVEEDEPVVRINKLRKEIEETGNRRAVKKKRREEPDDDEDDDGYNEHPELDDTEELDDSDESDDDGDRTIMSCIQKSILRRR